MTVPDTIRQLVDHFESNRGELLVSANETQIRREFVDPFFRALGWDIENRQGVSEANKEVIHEDSTKVGTATVTPEKPPN